MDYKPKKTMCAKCGEKPRRENQRYCKACHADYQRDRRHATPEKKLAVAIAGVVRKRVGRGMSEEMRKRCTELAARVASQIEHFNESADSAA